MQARPSPHAPLSVLLVVHDQFAVWRRPGLRPGAVELAPVAAWAPRWSGCGRVGVGIEAATGTQPDEHGGTSMAARAWRHGHGGTGIAQDLRHLNRIVASLEDKPGQWTVSRKALEQGGDRLGGDHVAVGVRFQASHADWRSPALANQAELGDPVIRPARDHRLAGGVT